MSKIKKEDFFNQIQELKYIRNINEKDLETLYDFYVGKDIDNCINPVNICDKVITEIFEMNKETWLPWSFLSTPIGKVIISIKLGVVRNEIYTASEIVDLTGYSRTHILNEVEKGNLKGEKKPKSILIYENDINEYLEKKGRGTTIGQLKDSLYKTKEEELKTCGYEREVEYK